MFFCLLCNFAGLLFLDGTDFNDNCKVDTDTCSQENTVCIAGVCRCDHDFKYDLDLEMCGMYSQLNVTCL